MTENDSDDGEAVIQVEGLHTRIGGQKVHDGLDLTVHRGEVMGVIGTTGSGKTILLHQILGLLRPEGGSIHVLGQRVGYQEAGASRRLRRRWGVLFQQGALFSALNVYDNIAFPMRELRKEHEHIEEGAIRELVALKLHMVGLASEDAKKFPDQLSGGMHKRAALARALALEAELLFLDEPTTGLDPISASALARLLADLHRELGMTSLMVTHDLRSLSLLADRVAVLEQGRLLTVGTPTEVAQYDHPFTREFFEAGAGDERLRALRST